MIEFYKYLSKIYPKNGKANQTCPHVQYERQVFWILYEFEVSPFPPFHDYQKYIPVKCTPRFSSLVPSFKYSSIQEKLDTLSS